MLQVVWELWWNGNPFALHGALASAQQRLAQPVAVPAATKGRQQEMDHLKKLGFLGSKYPITLIIMPVCRFSTDFVVAGIASAGPVRPD